jgi:hypothetical protein
MPQALITGTSGANPKPLATVCTNYRKLKLIACKSLAGPTVGPNTGLVKVGNSANASEQPFEMNPGDERSFDCASGAMEDLQRWFLTVATTGDGVVAVYG